MLCARVGLFVCLMVFYATFHNISVISWRSVLLVEETGGPWENHQPVASHWQAYHIMLYTSPWSRFELTASVVIGTDCIGSCIPYDHGQGGPWLYEWKLCTGIYLSIMDFLRGQYVIYGPFRIILTEDEVWYMDLLGLYWPKTKSEVNIILTGPYIAYWQSKKSLIFIYHIFSGKYSSFEYLIKC